MSDIQTAWAAGVDAVIADNDLSRGDFADALETAGMDGVSNADRTAWVDAVAAEYNRLGLINNPTYNNLRNQAIVNVGADPAKELFNALIHAINGFDETLVLNQGIQLHTLRDERDTINTAIDRCQELIDAEPNGTQGRLVKDAIRLGIDNLRGYRERVRDQINQLIGDPDG